MRLFIALIPLIALAQAPTGTLVENLPFTFDATRQWPTYQWSKDGRVMPWATNRTFTIDWAQEGDAGTYVVRMGNYIRSWTYTFTRAVTVTKTGSTVTLTPFAAGLPIFYTLDGTEPTVRSRRYTNAFTITNSNTIRASIIIPEGDSVKIIK